MDVPVDLPVCLPVVFPEEVHFCDDFAGDRICVTDPDRAGGRCDSVVCHKTEGNIYRQYHILGGNGDMRDLRRTFRHLPLEAGGVPTEVSEEE